MRRRFFTVLNVNNYFNIELLADGVMTFDISIIDSEYLNLLKISKNNIKDWKLTESNIDAANGDVIYFKSIVGSPSDSIIRIDVPCKIKGNIGSLCGYSYETNPVFSQLLSQINIIEIDDSFGRSIAMNCDICAGLFIGNSYLTSIVIPDYISTIPNSFFSGCSSLTNITIGNGVTSIGDEAFWNCSSLKSITIGNSVTSIGDWAFCDCTSLTNINIPNSVTSIGDDTFIRCSSLKSITIPNSVTSIGREAFYDCSSLTSITIGNSVNSIGPEAFQGCRRLISITCYALIAPSIRSYTFYNVSYGGTLYVPAGSDYSSWMSTDGHYLGNYNWTIEYI